MTFDEMIEFCTSRTVVIDSAALTLDKWVADTETPGFATRQVTLTFTEARRLEEVLNPDMKFILHDECRD